MENVLRHLPSVDSLLANQKIRDLEKDFPRDLILTLLRETLDGYRSSISPGRKLPSMDEIFRNISDQIRVLSRPGLRPLINATGVILHTNLGRAPLSEETIAAMASVSREYNNLEFDLESGERGFRDSHLEPLLCRLSGSESAIAVNNNASAVLLGLTVLARRKEVIISRGQAVEIGGGFRIPEVMRQSGAKLIEVGTTNCTRIRDYEEAITPRTFALMRVHPSNFKVMGFTQTTTLEEMVTLGKKAGIAIFDDLGSGCFIDTARFGLDAEPTIQESVIRGADLIFFSGDKLLGGPQAGIIIGKKVYIDKLKKHPMLRAMRLDKTRIAGLAATLLHYLKDEAITKIPVWQMIASPLKEIDDRAKLWAKSLGEMAQVIQGESLIGGGSMPGAVLPTKLVAIGQAKKPALAQTAARLLRFQDPPIVGRINGNILLLDPRTVPSGEDERVINALKELIPHIS